MSQNFDKIKEIIIDKLGVDQGKITKNYKYIDDLGADSLDTVELVLELEEHFDIEIPDDVASTLLTVCDVFNYLEANVK